MGIETALIAGSVGASLLGAMDTNDTQQQMAADQNAFQKQKMQQALGYLQPAYSKASDMGNQYAQQALALQGSTFMPQIQAAQQGNVQAQRMQIAAMPQYRNAIMGGNVDYSAFQPYTQQYDMNALAGLTNPQAFKYAPPADQAAAAQGAAQNPGASFQDPNNAAMYYGNYQG
jgi:hypothetical protein